MFHVQAEHHHAAGLTDLLFEGHVANLLLQMLCHTSACKQSIAICKRLYNFVLYA